MNTTLSPLLIIEYVLIGPPDVKISFCLFFEFINCYLSCTRKHLGEDVKAASP